MSTNETTATPEAKIEGYGSAAYRAYVLFALIVVYTFNFIDRTLIGILGEDIRQTFGLSDTMIGLLSGIVFALFYTILGIPVAMLAERRNRTTIITIAMALWSGMTAFCGLAQNTFQFAMARMMVGVGEAGCSPPSHSLISDYFPPEKRSTALSIYALGIPIGSMLAAVGGAWIASQDGLNWRDAFIFMGVPGVVGAILFKLTVKEPPRGYSDPGGAAATEAQDKPSPFEVFRVIGKKATFWHCALGGAMASFAGYGVGQFLAPYFIRVYDFTRLEAAVTYGVILGGAAGLGTFSSGWLADKIRPRHPNSDSWLPALGFYVSVPLYLIGYNAISLTGGDKTLAFWLAIFPLIIAAYAHYFYLGPMFAVTQKLVQPRMRATAAAVLLFVVNIIGYGMGPPVVGWISDQASSWQISRYDTDLTMRECGQVERKLKAARDGADNAITGAELDLAQSQNASFCAPARRTGVQWGVSVGAMFYLWAGIHFTLMGRRMRKEEWQPEKAATSGST